MQAFTALREGQVGKALLPSYGDLELECQSKPPVRASEGKLGTYLSFCNGIHAFCIPAGATSCTKDWRVPSSSPARAVSYLLINFVLTTKYPISQLLRHVTASINMNVLFLGLKTLCEQLVLEIHQPKGFLNCLLQCRLLLCSFSS